MQICEMSSDVKMHIIYGNFCDVKTEYQAWTDGYPNNFIIGVTNDIIQGNKNLCLTIFYKEGS